MPSKRVTTYQRPDPASDEKPKAHLRLIPSFCSDQRFEGLGWRQRWVFLALLSHTWRGPDRNGRHRHGCVWRPVEQIADELQIRRDHLREDLRAIAARGLIREQEEEIEIVDYDGWTAARSPETGESTPLNWGIDSPEKGECSPETGEQLPQNRGATPLKKGSIPPKQGSRIASAQQPQGFPAPSDVSQRILSDISQTPSPPAAAAATTGDGGDLGAGSRREKHQAGREETEPSSQSSTSEDFSLAGTERSEGPAGHCAAEDPAPDADLETRLALLREAGIYSAVRGDIAARCTQRLIRHIIALSEGKTNPPGWIRHQLTSRYEEDGTLADLAAHEIPRAIQSEPETGETQLEEPQPLSADEVDSIFSAIAEDRHSGTKLIDLLPIYGIPLMTTFLVRQKQIQEGEVSTGIRARLENDFANHFYGQQRLRDILAASRRRERYPVDFVGTDWRRRYADLPWSQEMRRVFDIPGADEEKSGEGTSEEQGQADFGPAVELGEDIVTRDSTLSADTTQEPAKMP